MPMIPNKLTNGTIAWTVMIVAMLLCSSIEQSESQSGQQSNRRIDLPPLCPPTDTPSSCLPRLLNPFAPSSLTALLTAHPQLLPHISRELHRLKSLASQVYTLTSQMEPVIKWGQSADRIWIAYKLSHRWDAPPCLEVRAEVVGVQENWQGGSSQAVEGHKVQGKQQDSVEDSTSETQTTLDPSDSTAQQQISSKPPSSSDRLHISITCHTGGRRLIFNKTLQLWGNVHTHELSPGQEEDEATFTPIESKPNGLGTYSITLQKGNYNETWPYLTMDGQVHQLWAEIGKMYPREYEEYRRVRAEIDEGLKGDSVIDGGDEGDGVGGNAEANIDSNQSTQKNGQVASETPRQPQETVQSLGLSSQQSESQSSSVPN